MNKKTQKLLDEDHLIKGLLSKNEHAFRQAVKSYHSSMIYLAEAIIGKSVAEEIVQDAWLTVFTKIETFKRQSTLKTWILGIVSNGALNRLRREKRFISASDFSYKQNVQEQLFDSTDKLNSDIHKQKWENETPDAVLESKELQSVIESSLKSLRPLQQAVIKLRDMEGLGIKEISEILDTSQTNVRVLLHRARLHIRVAIDRYQRGQNVNLNNNARCNKVETNLSLFHRQYANQM